MKRIYLVRHGETQSNADRYVPTKHEPLNEYGLMQADILVSRIKHLDIDTIVASDFPRAQDTVKPIADLKKMDFEINSDFGEVLEPTSIHNLSEDDEKVLEHRCQRNSNVTNPDWRMEDGQNFHDIFQRIKNARLFLENHEKNNILVASHSFFLALFGAAILLDNEKPTEEWFQVGKTLKVSNTGISLLTYDEGRWRLVTWNDHAHFAE